MWGRRRFVAIAAAWVALYSAVADSDSGSAAGAAPVPLKVPPGHGDLMFGIASGPSWSTELAVAARFAALAGLDQEEGPHGESGPRFAPLVEPSEDRAVLDLLTSPTTDLAILPLPLLERAARERPGIKSRIGYVAPLYLEEVHVIARQEIGSLDALAGRRVMLGAKDGIGGILFAALGLKVEVVDLPPSAALDALRSGALDAVVVVSGKPVRALAALGPETGLHLMSIPYSKVLETDFLPVRFGREDYPGLVGSEETTSVAVPTVLAGYLWPKHSERAQALGILVAGLLSHVGAPGGEEAPRKVKEINWAATLPGWQRLDAVQRWFDLANTATRREPPAARAQDKPQNRR